MKLREVLVRLWQMVRGGRGDRDVAEELAAHVALAEDELQRKGHSPQDAARLARVKAGNFTQAAEGMRDQRGIPELSAYWLDLKLGLRMLRKHWAFTLIAGLAMAATMTVSSAVFNLLSVLGGTSLPLEEGDRVVIVQSLDLETRQQQSPGADVFGHWREKMRSLVNVGAFRTVERDVTTNSKIVPKATVAEMSAAGFALARVNPLMGRFLLPEDERFGSPAVVVIGYDAWQTTFGADPGILGQAIQLDRVTHTVIGVMPEGFLFPVRHQYWTNLRTQPSDRVTVFARLAPGATLESAQAELATGGIGESATASGSGRPLRPFVRPYVIGLTGERSLGLAVLLPFVLPLLLIPPCTNVGALIYARTLARRSEFALRAALGASRGRIIAQIFGEVLVLTSAAAVVAVLLAPRVAEKLSYALANYGQPFWMDFRVSYGTILFTAGLAVIAALIVGAIPAVHATGRWQLAGLNAYRSSAPSLGRGWTAIVVAQVALSVAVVPTALEFAWHSLRPAVLGPGFPVKEFLTARVDLTAGGDTTAAAARLSALSAEVVRQLKAEPGVRAVTLSQYKPFEEKGLLVEVDSPGSAVSEVLPEEVTFNQVDAAFFDVFGIRLLEGRGFEPVDSDPRRGTIVVNRSFVNRLLAGESPLGRTVRVRQGRAPATLYKVVGLVDNQFAYSDQATMYRPLTPAAFVREDSDVLSVHLAMHTTPALPPGFAIRIHEITTALDPAMGVDDIQPLEEIYFFLSLFSYIGGSLPLLVALGVLLFAAVGVYTRMSFEVVQRRREIGIRSALGASPWNLVVSLFRGVFVPVLVGAGLGGLIALVLNFYLSPLLFEGGRPLPWIPPVAEAVVLLTGGLALFGPVRRALQVDTTEALRES